ncbi:MAG: urate hydroxylase PuuD [Alphaproteobacteria bacterium]|nr:urate hydroxylase PuuD [Alphaproteobacteria bacterium]
MLAFAADWANLLIRWGHMIAGIGWIGTSFYFIALDLSLKKREQMKEGVMGTTWEVHGGGFYHVEKFTVAPKELPGDLVWFKWEAYLTWLTGFLLLIVQFYLDAGAWMIDPDVMALEPWQAVGISIASLAVGWFVYDGLCRSPIGQKTTLLTVIGYLWVLAAAYFYTEVFSGRTAMIHVGAFIGTIMAANVFAVIIPNQKKVTAALLAGAAPDPKYGEIGKQRSIHNTYLTLPVLVTMVSGHYPMLSGHPQAWLIVAFIIVGGACLRHVLVSHEVGEPFATYRAALPVILIALFAAIYMTTPQQRNTADIDVTDVQVMAIVQKHCTSCHAAKPKNEAVDAPPKNIILENTDQLSRHGKQVLQFAVQTRAMPLGNETGMTAQERLKLGAWIDNQIDGE